jgi:thioredoxin reductase (NADPH)
MLGLRTIVLETSAGVGGQCSALYHEKPVYGVPLAIGMNAGDVVKQLYEQATCFGGAIFLGTTVSSIRQVDGGGFEISTKSTQNIHEAQQVCPVTERIDGGRYGAQAQSCTQRTAQAEHRLDEPANFQGLGDERELVVLNGVSTCIHSKTVIIAAGAGAFTPNKLGQPNEDEFAGKTLFYGISSIKDFAGKRVVVVGGGNAAVDWSLELSKIAKSVDLIHRRETFRCNQTTLQLLSDRVMTNCLQETSGKNVRIHTPFRVVSLEGNEGRLTRVKVVSEKKDVSGCGEFFIDADYLLVFCGLLANVNCMKDWGIALDGQKIAVNEAGETNVRGIFAAGDVVCYPNKLNILAVGFGEAAKAAYAVKRLLNEIEKG